MSSSRDRDRLVNLVEFNADNSPSIEISIVIDRIKNVAQICDLLSYEPTNYEVVIVADFSRKEELLRSVIRHFGLIKVNFISDGNLPSQTINALYRSHVRLYSRLVIVDARPTTIFTPLRIGAAMSSHNYTLQISSNRVLRQDSIKRLLLEVALRSSESFDILLSGRGERIALYRREVAELQELGIRGLRRLRRGYISYKLLK